MKNFNVKQSGSEVILEEVNPIQATVYEEDGVVDIVGTMYSMKARDSFAPLILTSIDPQIKVGDVIREDQLEISWQVFEDGTWNTVSEAKAKYMYTDLEHRPVAKLKQPVKPEKPKRYILTGNDKIDEMNEENYLVAMSLYNRQMEAYNTPVHETPNCWHCKVPNHLHGTACGWMNGIGIMHPQNEQEAEWNIKWHEANPNIGFVGQCNCANRKVPAGGIHGCNICNPPAFTVIVPLQYAQIVNLSVKPFTVAFIHGLLKQVTEGDISYSRMVELMNERANSGHVHETPKSGHDLETCTEKEEKVTDTHKCNKCGGRTALITGTFYYHPDREPYMNGIIEEAKVESGECWMGGYKCDDCGNEQDFWTE